MSEDLVVALVLLRPASGRPLTGASLVTAETLAQYAPDPAEAEAAAGVLREEGFQVGPLGGISMAVTGPRRAFERLFGIRIQDAPDGGWVAEGGRRELPLERLPPALAERLAAATFEEPAEPVP